MVVKNVELVRGLAILADNENLRVTVKQSCKGGLICGVTSLVGGIIAGPLGLAFGGTVGGIAAYMSTKDTFRSLGDIIRNDLTNEQQERLTNHIMEFSRSLEITDMVILLELIRSNGSIQQEVLKLAVNFFSQELQLKIAN